MRFAASAILASVAVLVVPRFVAAQASTNHWSTIENLTRSVGGLDKADRLPQAQVALLVTQLTQRGQAYLDLYEYHRALVRDHARMLDSTAKAGGPTFAAAPFYLGRALQETGEPGAAAAYARAANSAPGKLRSQAAQWAGTLGTSGKGWQQDFVDWRRGRPVATTTCPADASLCPLFAAILNGSVATLGRLQIDRARSAAPDFMETRFRGTDSVTVEFSDPAQMYLLAAADFAMVVRLTEKRRDLDAYRGLALLRTGRTKDALPLLKAAASTASGAVLGAYYGEAQFVNGDRSGAEATWQALTGPGALVALDVRTFLRIPGDAVMRQFQAERTRGLDRTGGRIYLARALLRTGKLAEVEQVLNAERPVSQGSRVSSVLPSVLAVASFAEYERGQQDSYRDRFNFARSDLADFATSVPVVRSLLRPLQELTQVTDAPAKIRGLEEPQS